MGSSLLASVETDPEVARKDQWERVDRQATAWGVDLVKAGQDTSDWSYHPPEDDDPATWTGVVRYCYVDAVYRWYCQREVALRLGGGPFYCPAHGQKRPAKGWQVRNCLACCWDNPSVGYLYEEVMRTARELGRKRYAPIAADGSWSGYVTKKEGKK